MQSFRMREASLKTWKITTPILSQPWKKTFRLTGLELKKPRLLCVKRKKTSMPSELMLVTQSNARPIATIMSMMSLSHWSKTSIESSFQTNQLSWFQELNLLLLSSETRWTQSQSMSSSSSRNMPISLPKWREWKCVIWVRMSSILRVPLSSLWSNNGKPPVEQRAMMISLNSLYSSNGPNHSVMEPKPSSRLRHRRKLLRPPERLQWMLKQDTKPPRD